MDAQNNSSEVNMHAEPGNVGSPLNSSIRMLALTLLAVVAVAGSVVCLATRGFTHDGLIDAGMIAFFGFGATTLLAFCFQLGQEGRLTVEARWGTLGGGNKGYSLSPAAALFVLLLAYLIAFLGLGYVHMNKADNQRKDNYVANCKKCEVAAR